MLGNYIILALFIAVLLGIACWEMLRTKTTGDFLLGGKTLGPWILAISYGTTYFSAVVFIGFAGQFGWSAGFNGVWVGLMNALVGGTLAWLVLGKRTRHMTHNLNTMTMPEFFSARYGSTNMRWLTACVIFVFLIPYSASVFAGLGYLFQQVFHLTMPQVLTLICVVTGFYVFLGGYKAAARIDFVQGIIMFFGTLLMVYFVLKYFGGFAAAVEGAKAGFADHCAKFGSDGATEFDSVRQLPNFILWSVIFMTSVGVWGLPQMVHKYYAIKDESQIFRGVVITTIFALVIGCSAYFCGAFSHLLDPAELSEKMGGKFDSNALVPIMLIKALPPALMLVILLLVLSASMSTLSSLVLVSSSAVSIDLYRGFLAKGKSEKHYLWVMRFLSTLFIVISWVIALYNPSWIVALMSLSWGAIAGTFLAPYLYGLYWRGTTKAGAYAGMLTGFLTMNGIYWYRYFAPALNSLLSCECLTSHGINLARYFDPALGPAAAKGYAPVAASIAIILPFLVVPVVSLVTRRLPKDLVEKAFAAGKPDAE